MAYTFTSNLTQNEFDDFSQNHLYGSFFQSSQWAGVKNNWVPIYTGVYKDERLVAAALVLKRPLFLKYSFMYAPRGPLLDFKNQALLSFYLNELKKLTKQHFAIALTLDPYIVRASYSMRSAMEESGNFDYDDQLVKDFNNLEFIHQGFSKSLKDTIQPRFQPVINFNEKALKAYTNSRGYKNAVRASEKNVKIKRISVKKLSQFVDIIKKTEDAKNISLRGESYFAKLINNFGSKSLLSIAYLDLESELESLTFREKDMRDRLSNPTIKMTRRREYESQMDSILKEKQYIQSKIKKHGKTANLSGLLAVRNNSKAELLYAGMDRDFMKYSGSNVTYIDAVNWAQESGCNSLYFGGSSGFLNEGIDRFKASFNPSLEEYFGEFIFVNKKFMNFLFNTVQKVRLKL